MLLRIAGKLVWWTGKLAMKHVVIPLAITGATAYAAGKLAEHWREQPQPVISPAP